MVVWGSLWVTLWVPSVNLEVALGWFCRYSGVTLGVLWDYFKVILGISWRSFGIPWHSFEGNCGVYCQYTVTYITVDPGQSYRLFLNLVSEDISTWYNYTWERLWCKRGFFMAHFRVFSHPEKWPAYHGFPSKIPENFRIISYRYMWHLGILGGMLWPLFIFLQHPSE